MGVRESLHVRLDGVTPLLMRSARLADPLDEFTIALERLTRKRNKTRADHLAIARLEWYGGMWTKEGKPCIPGVAIESCLRQAAKLRKAGPSARAGISVSEDPIVLHEGAADLAELWEDERFRLRAAVRVRGARTMRTRPRFPRWSVALTIAYVPTIIGRNELLDDLIVAGDQIGLGDWHPPHGMFRTEVRT